MLPCCLECRNGEAYAVYSVQKDSLGCFLRDLQVIFMRFLRVFGGSVGLSKLGPRSNTPLQEGRFDGRKLRLHQPPHTFSDCGIRRVRYIKHFQLLRQDGARAGTCATRRSGGEIE